MQAAEEANFVPLEGPAGDAENCDFENMSSKEYSDYFHNLPRKAIVPQCELVKPGGVVFSTDNIHIQPFGCNMVPFGDRKILSYELEMLKRDAGLRYATVSLELTRNQEFKEVDKCAFCGEEANNKCQSCMSVAYCSREHQKIHWRDHRPFCTLYEVARSPTEECYLVAKTNIKKGEAVLIEDSYITTPFSTNEQFNSLRFDPVSEENHKMSVGKYTIEEYETNVCRFPVVCLGCSVYIYGQNIFYCVCGWPICGHDCNGIELHQKWECAYFQENTLEYEDSRKSSVLAPRLFGIIRAILIKRNDPAKWEMLFDDTCQKLWENKMSSDGSILANVEYFLVVLRKVFGFSDLKYSEINSILAVMDVKGVYGCSYEDQGARCRRIISVYLVAAMIRHRCVGNVFGLQTDSGAFHVVASRAIKKGETLYLNCSSQEGDLLHITERQNFAMSKMNRLCDCILCSDLNEGGKNLSTIVCLKCKRRGSESLMMMETPTNLNTSWKCLKCGGTKTNRQVQTLLQGIRKDMDCIDPELHPRSYADVLRTVIAKYKGTVLHPEHALILSAEYNIIFLLMDCNHIASLHPEETAYLQQVLNTRINTLKDILPDAHSSVVSMKMRVATMMVEQVSRGPLSSSRNVLKTFEDLQTIHDDIAQLFVENTRSNALQGYILICLRKMRKQIAHIGELFNDERRRLSQSIKCRFPYKAVENLAVSTPGETDK